MSITYPSSIIDARLQVVVAAMGAAARVQIGTAGMATVLTSVILPNPPATVAGGVLTFVTPQVDPFAAATGIAAAARVTDLAGNTVISGLTVSTGAGTDITISLINITAGSIVTFQSGSYTGR